MARWEDPTPEHPVRLGRYELIRRIGVGGMAQVFLARLLGPAQFEKRVVVKRILPRLAQDPLMVRMFVEEARIAAAADHDNIAKVYELARTEAGEYLMVMEFIDGIDLEGLLRQAAERQLEVPTWFSVHVAAQTLEALSFLHGLVDEQGRPRNVIHRDATPSNVFLSHLGQVKLSDFGVARFEGKSPTTQAGQLKGKIAYMSPEQLRARDLDARADVFSVGVMLWESLTQERLFGHLNEMQAMMAICDPERPAPSERVPGLSPRLDMVCARALALDRDARYPSAEAFQADLLDVLHSLRPPVRPRDVRAVLEQLSGRAPPTEETTGLRALPSIERSFALPIEDIEDTPEDAGPDTLRAEPSPVPEAARAEVSTPPPPAPADDFESTDADMLATVDEAQDPAVAMEVAELRAMMSGALPEVGPPTELVESGAVAVAQPPAPKVEDSADEVVASPTVSLAAAAAPTPVFRARTAPGQTASTIRWPQVVARAQAAAEAGGGLEVAARGEEYIALPEIGRLTGQDLAYDLEPPSNVTVVGQLSRIGLTPLLARLGFERATGVLAVARPQDGAWYELELFEGRPTQLISPVAATQLPDLLSSRGGFSPEQVARLAHRALAERRPLAELAAALGGPRFDHPTLSRARLAAVFGWADGDYTFNADRTRPRGHQAFAASTLALLPELVAATRSIEALLGSVQPVLRRRLEPAPHLLTAQALFTSEQRASISRLVEAPVERGLSQDLTPRHTTLALVQVLLESGLAS